MFFITTDEASPAAAYLTLNDPVRDADRIRRDVAAGFIVRTRADANRQRGTASSSSASRLENGRHGRSFVVTFARI